MRRLLFIYNPNAGKGQVIRRLADILDIFVKNGYMPTVYPTQAPGDARETAGSLGMEFDMVVCSGGDGTLSEVISGLMTIDKYDRPCVGYIPAGSTNDYARNLLLPHNMKKAAKIAVRGLKFSTDIGSFNGDKFFTYVASFGSISDISAFTPQKKKKFWGHAAYVVEGIRVFPNMKNYHLRITWDGGCEEGWFYLGMITNSNSVGGFVGLTGADVELNDGVFEGIFLRKTENLEELNRQMRSVLLVQDKKNPNRTYLKSHVDKQAEESGVIVRAKSKRFVVETLSGDSVQWVIDGDDAGIHEKVEIENRNMAVDIMVDD